MADTGWVGAGTGTNITGPDIDWVDAQEIDADDGSYATVTLTILAAADYLAATNFDMSSVPAGATIDGIEFNFIDYGVDIGSASWFGLYLNLADDSSGGTQPANKPAFWGVLQTDTAGGSAELWGETPDRVDVVDIDWGVRFQVLDTSSGTNTSIDHIQQKVYYTTESVTGAGTIVGADETDITDGDITIILTLIGVTWVTAGAPFEAQREGILDGITTSPAQTYDWDNAIRAAISDSQCVRTNNTVVTITIPAAAAAAYQIVADEVYSVTVPASATTGADPLTDADFATVQALPSQVLAPTAIVTQTNLTGAVTDIDELVDSPDSNWLVAA